MNKITEAAKRIVLAQTALYVLDSGMRSNKLKHPFAQIARVQEHIDEALIILMSRDE